MTLPVPPPFVREGHLSPVCANGFFGGGRLTPQNTKAENNFNEARVSSSVLVVLVGKRGALTAPRSEAQCLSGAAQVN
jgi:hypothetical protein